MNNKKIYTDTKHLFINEFHKPENVIARTELEKLMEDYENGGGKITKLPSKYKRNCAVEDLKEEKKKRKRRKKK